LFFQAEDGIRDFHVTGVQTCALPILRQAAFFGFLVAMSSTAVVLKLLEDAGQTSSLHGRLTIAVLIFQDLAVVPLMLMLPVLGEIGRASCRERREMQSCE